MEPSDQLLLKFAAQERWRDLLGEVLAVLNRDGGHYQTQHGAGRAAIEGIRSHYQIFTTIDALQAENARLREQAEALATALADARRWMMATNDYESLSPAGHSLTRDAISTADAALREYREATQ